MLSKAIQGAGGVGKDPVAILSTAGIDYALSDASRTVTINSGFSTGDFLLGWYSNRTSTPPATASGWTSILTIPAARSMNVVYKYATSTSESMSFTGATGSIAAFSGVNSIGSSNTVALGTSATQPIPDLSGMVDDGTSFVVFGHYVGLYVSSGSLTSISSPFTLIGSSLFGGQYENVSSSSFTGLTATASNNQTYRIGFSLELKA